MQLPHSGVMQLPACLQGCNPAAKMWEMQESLHVIHSDDMTFSCTARLGSSIYKLTGQRLRAQLREDSPERSTLVTFRPNLLSLSCSVLELATLWSEVRGRVLKPRSSTADESPTLAAVRSHPACMTCAHLSLPYSDVVCTSIRIVIWDGLQEGA